MAIYKVKYGQSIYDIATEKYGSVEGVANILQDNPSIELDTYLELGREIIISESPTSITNQNIRRYFSNKTITNTDSANSTPNLLNGYIYGTISTRNVDGEAYIDSTIRQGILDHIKLSNRDGGTINLDRVSFSSPFTIDSDGDELEMIVNYEDFQSYDRFVPIGSVNGSTMRLDISATDGRISLYDSFGEILISNPIETESNVDVTFKIRCEVLGTTKNYFLEVNGVESSALNVGDTNLSFDMIGGTNKISADGYNGLIKYFRYNDYRYRFNEVSGIYVHKNIR
mgnify:CR=1 FL=1